MERDKIFSELVKTEEPIYSFHAFVFPFEWKPKDESSKNDLLEDQVDFARIREIMADEVRWQRREGWDPPKTLAQFNEASYFYDFVRPVLYDTGDDQKTIQLHYFFNKQDYPNLEYCLETSNKTYTLEVDDINLAFYNTGVGVLVFHLHNKHRDQSAPDDILRINNLGRRVFPPFFSTDAELVGTQAFFDDADWQTGLDRTKHSELPNQVSITYQNGHHRQVLVVERYQQWLKDRDLYQTPYLVSELIPDPILSEVKIRPVLDDRMYVMCWYGNTELANHLKEKAKVGFTYDQKPWDWWFEFVFNDSPNGKSSQHPQTTKDLLTKATYERWSGLGTRYGVSRYSFMCLTGSPSSYFMNALICSHVQTIYYNIALIGLVQRASLMRFSEEVTEISKLARGDKRLSKRISSLYKEYIRFVNRIYFREVTAQDQGIELYQLLQNQMDLENQVKALQSELQELHQYVLILDEDERANKLDLLTYFAAFFIVPGFIVGYFGVSDFSMRTHWGWITLFCVVSAGIALGVIRSSGRWRIFWLILTALVTLFIIVLFPLLIKW